MMELLLPARKIIEIHLADDSSIKDLIEIALSDLYRAVDMIGDILERKVPSADTEWP